MLTHESVNALPPVTVWRASPNEKPLVRGGFIKNAELEEGAALLAQHLLL
jgi:hypothetical protein